jgi:hypothetical protein
VSDRSQFGEIMKSLIQERFWDISLLFGEKFEIVTLMWMLLERPYPVFWNYIVFFVPGWHVSISLEGRKCLVYATENVFSTSHYPTSIIHQDIYGVEPMHVDLIYVDLTSCMPQSYRSYALSLNFQGRPTFSTVNFDLIVILKIKFKNVKVKVSV